MPAKTLWQLVEEVRDELKDQRKCLTAVKESIQELLDGLDQLKGLSGCSEDWEEQEDSNENSDGEDSEDMQVEPCSSPRKVYLPKRSKNSSTGTTYKLNQIKKEHKPALTSSEETPSLTQMPAAQATNPTAMTN